MSEDVETKVQTFEELLPADIFLSYAINGRNCVYMKLESRFNIGTCGGMANAVGIHDGGFYLFQDDSKVELNRHPWEWVQGYQVTKKCLECGRPREKP